MPRPGTKITKFPPSTPTSTKIPTSTTLPTLPLTSENSSSTTDAYYPPPENEPISFPPEMTIDELIELRRIVGKNDPKYWAAFDEIQRKRDALHEAHQYSLLKAIQDLTIALYTVNKMKVPETVGKPFEED